MRISDQKKHRIDELISQGEKLNPLDLEVFYRWIHSAYEELGFHPGVQERFDQYCRSSCDTNTMRVYIGLWLLKLSLWAEDPTIKQGGSEERPKRATG